MPRLTLSVLGSFHAALNGLTVTGFESDKVRALLAYLAVASDRPHRRETLAGMLWPQRPEASARRNLNQALASLQEPEGMAAAIVRGIGLSSPGGVGPRERRLSTGTRPVGANPGPAGPARTAAEERGRASDLWATAGALLDELGSRDVKV